MKIKDYEKKDMDGFAARIKNFFRGQPHRILLIAAGVLLIAAAIVFLCIYLEGDMAANNAQQLLEAYESGNAVADEPFAAQPNATHQAAAEAAEPPPSSAPMPTEYEGYQILGKLTIEAIGQELPIIAQMSRSALKVSVCYYEGVMMGEDGSMIITGHNYASGAHFGDLNEVKIGDTVVLTAPDHTEYVYEVYDMVVVKPDQEEALYDCEGIRELTLLTCTSHGNRRLIVRCRSIAE